MFSLIPWRRSEEALTSRANNPFELMWRDMLSLMNRVFEDEPMLVPELETERFWGVTSEENETEMTLRFELPGFEASELAVHLTGNVLTVEAKHEPAEGKEEPTRRTRRVTTLPGNLDLEKVEATYRNGVLEVRVPWAAEARGRKVEVKT